MKKLWHMIWYHWLYDKLGWLWYSHYELSKPELGTIFFRSPRLYRKLDIVLIPNGTIRGMELHLNNVTDEEWQLLIESANAAELSANYLEIMENRKKNVSSK